MPIDLVAQFPKYEKAILRHSKDWQDQYFKSNVSKKLRARYDRLQSSINMSFPVSGGRSAVRGTNEFLSKVAFPLVRERFLFRRALIKQNYRSDPLVTITPTGATPLENALTLQDVLNLNFKATKLRSKAFEKWVYDVAAFGSAVAFTRFERSSKTVKRTVQTALGPQQMSVSQDKAVCQNSKIHILNYFQNHTISDCDESDFKGFIERISVAHLIALAMQDPANYIRENLAFVIKEAKSSSMQDVNYFVDDKELNDFSKSGLDVSRFYGTLPIDGNEDSEVKYFWEIAGDKIIRFQDNPNDEDLDPLTVLKIRHHPEFWWGNTDSEDVFPHENFFNLFMNLKADQAIKTLERYIFFQKGSIDPADINNRHVNGGMIPVEMKAGMTSLPNMLFEYQGQDKSMSSSDWLLREVKESAQKMSTNPDFLRHGNKGGMANNTATAANILSASGDSLEADMLEIFSDGVAEVGRKNAVMLIQYLGERIAIRPDPKAAQREFYKEQIMGQYAFTTESSLQKSSVSEAVRLQNVLTALINFKGSGDPSWQNVNIIPIVRNWIRKLDVGDVDEVYPEQAALQQTPGYVQSAAIPGHENAGAVQETAPAAAPQVQPIQPTPQGAM